MASAGVQMDGMIQGVIAVAEDRPREGWDDPVRGSVSWRTLFSSDITPTDSMTAGVATISSGGGALQLHRHREAEIYYILEGRGVMALNGVETEVSAGTAIFIPGDAEHGIRNPFVAPLTLFYVFPTGCFADIVYRFPD